MIMEANKWLLKEQCTNMGITKNMVTDYNPQSNALIEQVHPVLEMHYACSN